MKTDSRFLSFPPLFPTPVPFLPFSSIMNPHRSKKLYTNPSILYLTLVFASFEHSSGAGLGLNVNIPLPWRTTGDV
ncbi:hypothetical protein K439DRAFT_718993 [Ramaria rubella]|nr:hypothetical protein K439DRAFT_718993 [Ramaria rubella]